MPKKLDLTGKIFGRWTVIKEGGRHLPGGFVKCLCRCECGTIKEVIGSVLNKGESVSCGCYQKEVVRNIYTHGATKDGKETIEYTSWNSMKSRCINKNNPQYKDYGGRGIKICERWLGENGFNNFLKDMGKRPSILHTLDKYPNNDGNYEPSNCRWGTKEEQSYGKRSNVWLTYKGETKIIKDWSIKLGIKRGIIGYHVRKGRSIKYIIENYKKRGINATVIN